MLDGLMMDRQISVPAILDYGAETHAKTEIVSARVEGDIHRYTYADARARAGRLANVLRDHFGIRPGDRVATLAWNGYRHFELYYAAAGVGAVCHTINPRLFHDQLVYIVNHAQDRVLFLDASFVPLIEGLADQLPAGLRYVVMIDADKMPETTLAGAECYETLLAAADATVRWTDVPETAACGLCYTSGTTGNPKGVLYSHRSSLLHSVGVMCVADGLGLTQHHTILPVVPLFHVNAWGLPYVAPLTGPRIAFPGGKLDGASLFSLMDGERVTSAWGVPTVWLGLLAEMRKQGRKPDGFEIVIIGGSAAPRPMIEEFERDWGVTVVHGWGMTEISPVGSMGILPKAQRDLPLEARLDLKVAQGRRMFGVEMKIIGPDGGALPHDGVAFGELCVRGPAVMSGYFEDEDGSSAAFDADGWLKTGDVARITPDGFMYIVDRTKDVIKSGGEWISSIDLENAALGHPAVNECAVIAAHHPKWDERPLLVAVLEEGKTATADDIRAYLADKVAKWWLPDDVVFVDELPHTATGKLSKRHLRERFRDHVLPTATG